MRKDEEEKKKTYTKLKNEEKLLICEHLLMNKHYTKPKETAIKTGSPLIRMRSNEMIDEVATQESRNVCVCVCLDVCLSVEISSWTNFSMQHNYL